MSAHIDGPLHADQLRVLVIDDDDDQRVVVTRLLNRHGISDVLEAASADVGLAAAADSQPHLILLDLAMPGRSGSDALPDLLAAAPEALIVILSNLSRRTFGPGLIRQGAMGYVEKQTAPERLVDEILVAAALTDIARRHVLDLPREPSAPLAARRFARDVLTSADRAIADDVELLVSELISNAVIHAAGDPRLEVHISPGIIRVAVRDDAAEAPTPRTADLERPGGRGLQLVDTLASRWGSDIDSTGKSVWFEIDRTTPGTDASRFDPTDA